MKIQLSQLVLFSPDELIPYWWVSHDFADLLALEYSRDAAKVLKRVIPPSHARIDYEADAVTLRMSRNNRVIPTLHAIYEYLAWDTAELAQAEPNIVAFKRPRPRKVAVGDVFLIPITPELFGIGQVLALNHKAPTVAIFKAIGRRGELEPLANSSIKPLTILHIGGESLYKGLWHVFAAMPVRLDPTSGPGGKMFSVGSSSYGGDGPVVDLLRAHAGMRSWEEGYADAKYLRKLVL